MKFHYTKVIQILIWLAVAYNLWHPFGGEYTQAVHVVGIALLLVHFGEYVVFYKTIQQRPESKAVAFVMTVVFGILYWRDFPYKK